MMSPEKAEMPVIVPLPAGAGYHRGEVGGRRGYDVANVLIFPNLDASTAAFKVLAQLGQAHVVGPMLLGANHSVHPLQPGADVHSILLLGALAVVEAQEGTKEVL